MNKEMSLDVALDIVGTLRMMKIDEISNETDEEKKPYSKRNFQFSTQKKKLQTDFCSLKYQKMSGCRSWIRYKTIMHPN